NPRGFAIKFTMPDGLTTDIVAHSFNGFPTVNSDQFRELLLAIGSSGSDAAKPTQLDQFLSTHPVAKTFLTTQHNPASYATISYFGVNAFKFTSKQGASHFIRYRFIPEKGERLLTSEQMAKETADYLQNEITAHIAKAPVRFKMYAQIAEDGDDIENPSVAWPETRKQVLLGVIELQKLASNTAEADKQLSFIPNNIPDGIATADPMLNFRSQAYPISVKERQ
ncbi:MAG TPA: catalase, partial [Segetibacter sp.]|nr:catalase [Segetibacter sp.]